MTTYSAYQPPPGPSVAESAGPLPVLVAFADPAPQSRATIAFRSLLLIPHAIVLYFVQIAANFVAFVGWWAALFTGRLPDFAVTFLTGYLRWTTRVAAYEMLLTDVYPPFSLDEEPGYPVRVAIPAPQPLNRLAVFFRAILSIPAQVVVSVVAVGAFTLAGFVAWLIALVRGRLPDALYQAYAAVLRYTARAHAYLFLVTPAYPRGLFGDTPGTPAVAPLQAASVAPAGPASWLIILSQAARRLLVVFSVLGVLLLAGYAVLIAAVAVSGTGPRAQLQTAYNKLDSQLVQYDSAVNACDDSLGCVTHQDALASGYFLAFARQAQTLSFPAADQQDALQVEQEALGLAAGYGQLSQATSVSAYNATANSLNVSQSVNQFVQNFIKLRNEL